MEPFFTPTNNTEPINQEVYVNAFYFKSRARQLASFPRQMEYAGRQYYFGDNSLRYQVRRGQQLVQLFDVSDGQTMFRLRNVGTNWQLINARVAR